MELRHLRYFVAVAEELSFTRAAERLHIGQPPLSHQIQMLEAEVGAQLLERSKRWVRLTEAGKLFLDDARRILALSHQAVQTAQRAERGEAGELRVGFTFSTPLTPLFATVINRYRQRYPGVTLTLHEMSTFEQLDAIGDRRLDLGLVRPPEQVLPDNVDLTVLRRDPLVLVLPVEHPLAHKQAIAISDLKGLPLVMFPKTAGTGIHPQIFRLCKEAGFVPNIAVEAAEGSTIIGLVAAGSGISVLPSSFEIIRMGGVCYRPLADPEANTALLLARRKDEISPLVAGFVAVAEDVAEEAAG
ncbi:UNVERIFIED_ORG: DNA-binding transcriptional LysR family regulator [Zoogloea ramigera]|uniref:LysR substrate-binding domain-containing protein n=1 Tax=Duganella zoogloeoides TaxID=75659 RepID=A0ABZ0XUI2_9BURK|nr:LysR substrate-binding domain-containing protein [Duganella zoogloeoides]WQH03406.1 LysR substrate-binding domain-containing protein [Duganella zoogloeoides]